MSKVLIVVDMLNDFVHKDGALFFQAGADIIPAVIGCLEKHIVDGGRVIFINDAHAEDDKEFDRFDPHAIKDTWGSAIVADIVDIVTGYESMVFGSTVIKKKRYSGFYDTNLAEQLKIWEADEVTVVGVCTSICVMDTVGGLANRDYKIMVPPNAVADFDNAAHHAALGRMGALYGAEIIQP